MVGARGFEPPTLWSQTRCATRLRYAPESRCNEMEGGCKRFSLLRNGMRRCPPRQRRQAQVHSSVHPLRTTRCCVRPVRQLNFVVLNRLDKLGHGGRHFGPNVYDVYRCGFNGPDCPPRYNFLDLKGARPANRLFLLSWQHSRNSCCAGGRRGGALRDGARRARGGR